MCYEEAFKYAMERETFGKKLIQHQVRLVVFMMLCVVNAAECLVAAFHPRKKRRVVLPLVLPALRFVLPCANGKLASYLTASLCAVDSVQAGRDGAAN